MKKIIPNIIALLGLIVVLILYKPASFEESEYLYFLTNHYVLNVALAIIGIGSGLLVRNYFLTLIASTVILLIYCSTEIFMTRSWNADYFFLAIYTVFIAFSSTSNLLRHYKDWLLSKDG